MVCAAFARPPRESHTVGRLLPSGQVTLNPKSPILRGNKTGQCCGAIPLVLASLTEGVRMTVEAAGGLGCGILQGPLVA
jgi:hypothetical protein